MAISSLFLIALGIGLFLALLPLLTGGNRRSVAHLWWLLPAAAVLLVPIVVVLLVFGSFRSNINFHRQTGMTFHGGPDMPAHTVTSRMVKGAIWRNVATRMIFTARTSREPHEVAALQAPSSPPPAATSSQLAISETRQIATTHFRARGTSDKPPIWLGETSDNIRSDGRIKKTSVSSEWFATPDEALDQVTRRTEEAVGQAFLEQHGISMSGISFGLIEHSAVGDCQLERIMKDFGKGNVLPMFRAHARLNIDTSSGSMLHQHWAAQVRYHNLWRLGVATACLTLCLGAFGQFLRWNRTTEGRYRGRLVTAATAVATASVTAAVWLPSWFLGSPLR